MENVGGKHKWLEGKSIEGSLACFAIAFASGAVYMNLINMPISYLNLLLGAIVATIVEGLGKWLNDNLTMAPAAALAMWLFSKIL